MRGIKVGVICFMALLNSVGGPLLSLVENQTVSQNAVAQAAGDIYGIADIDGNNFGVQKAVDGQCDGSINKDIPNFTNTLKEYAKSGSNQSPFKYHTTYDCLYQLALNQVNDIDKRFQEALVKLHYLISPSPKINPDGTASNANYAVENGALVLTGALNGSLTAGDTGRATWDYFATDRSHINDNVGYLDKILKVLNTLRPPNYGDANKDPVYGDPVQSDDKLTGLWIPNLNIVFDDSHSLRGLKNQAAFLEGADPDPGDPGSEAYGTVKDFVGVYKKLLYDLDYPQLAFVKKLGDAIVQTNAANSAAGAARCGAVSSFDPIASFIQAICALEVSISDFSGSLLNSSAQLLASASGIPGGDGSGLFASLLPVSQAKTPSEVKTPLQNILIDSGSDASRSVQKAYQLVLDLLNTVLILGFIAIALANILQIQVNTYSIKKLLPGLIIGFIVAHFSFFAVRAGLELSGQASNLFLQQSKLNDACTSTSDQSNCGIHGFVKVFSKVSQAPNGDTSLLKADGKTPDPAKIVQQAFLNLFVLVAAVLLFILGFLFLIRFVIFFFVIPLAPLAFFGLFFTPLSFAWSRWSKLVTGWLFMPAVSMFWIWLAFVWFQSVAGATGTGAFGYLIAYVFGIVALYLAIRTPFQMAGEAKFLVDRWNGLGKSAFNSTPVGRATKQWSGNFKDRSKLLQDGPIIQNRRLSKTALAKAVNKAPEKYALQTESQKNTQKAISEEAKILARQELQEGKGLLKKRVSKKYNAARFDNTKRGIITDQLKTELDTKEAEFMAKTKSEFAENNKDYLEIEGRIQAIKDQIGQYEDISKSMLRLKKTELQQQGEYQDKYVELQRKRIKKLADAEVSESRRDENFNDKLFNVKMSDKIGKDHKDYEQELQRVKNNRELLDQESIAKVAPELRTKSKEKILLEHNYARTVQNEAIEGINKARKAGDKEQMLHLAKEVAEFSTGNNIMTTDLGNMVKKIQNNEKVTEKEIEEVQGTLLDSEEGLKAGPKVTKLVFKRFKSDSNVPIVKSSDFAAEDGLFKHDLLSQTSESLELLSSYTTNKIGAKDKDGKLLVNTDSTANFIAISSLMSRGKLDKDSTKSLRESYEKLYSTDASFKRQIDVATSDRGIGALTGHLEKIEGAANEKAARDAFRTMNNDIDLNAIGFSERTFKTPSNLSNFRGRINAEGHKDLGEEDPDKPTTGSSGERIEDDDDDDDDSADT